MNNLLTHLKRVDWRSRRTIAALVIIALAIILAIFLLSDNTEESGLVTGLREVETIVVADYARGALGIAVPTANGNSFVIRAESGGKVTRAASTGAVAQGALIAQLENSSQRAAVTQAEGAYDAAVAAAGGNATSQESAKQDGVRTWTTATSKAAETLRTSIDAYFAEVRGTQGTTGFRLEAFGNAQEINNVRNAIENNILERWETEQVSEATVAAELQELDTDLTSIGSLIDRIAALVPRQSITDVYSEADRSADAATLAAARAAITAQQENVDAARTAITNASGSGDASAQAQVKQALGALQAARASYEKTFIRAPFAGTLTSVNVTTGDVISSGNDVAIIIPKEGVETERSFVLPLSSVKYTPAGALVYLVNTEDILESRTVETGLVTADAITVMGLNGDETIVKDVRGLKAGEHVDVSHN